MHSITGNRTIAKDKTKKKILRSVHIWQAPFSCMASGWTQGKQTHQKRGRFSASYATAQTITRFPVKLAIPGSFPVIKIYIWRKRGV